MIFDSSHGEFLAHQAGGQWILIQGEELLPERIWDYSGEEEKFQELWQAFVSTIAIESRVKPKLQMQMLPKSFRPYMTEKF